MKNNKRSFSTRLSLYIIAVTSVLFIASFLLYFTFSKTVIINEVFKKSKAQLHEITQVIDATLKGVSITVNSNVLYAEQYLESPAKLKQILKNIGDSNKAIYGCSIALDPDHYNDKQYFMLYANKVKDSVRIDVLGSEEYNYTEMEWYYIPMETGEEYWSEPYFDKGAGNTIMTTYSKPIRNKNGKIIGVITADVSLNWFSQIILSHKPYKRSYAFLLSRNGSYLVHREQDLILEETYFETTDHMKNEQVTEIGKRMIALESGSCKFMNDDTLSYAFYEPIPRVGWSVATVSVKSDVMESFNRMTAFVWTIALISLILIFVSTIFIIRKIVSPLKLFADSAATIAQGNFNAPMPKIKNRDEMYNLRESFVAMQESLKNYIEELKITTSARERIESELEIAKQIQMGMLPKVFPAFPHREDMDLYATLRPAKEVGGDLYDFFIKNEKLFFTVGDASGKGVPASLLMAVTSSLFRSVSSHTIKPSEILNNINNAIAENNEANMFITLFIGVFDLVTGELEYSNAGHNPPIIISNNTVQFLECEPNLALGIFSGITFIDQKIILKQFDTLFLYSDGLTEAENKYKELYSDKRLLNILSDKSPHELIEIVEASVKEFVDTNEQSDDITMLAINYNGPMTKELIFKNDISQISLLEEFVSTLGVDPSLEINLNLALEEVISNIILYAFPDKIGETISLKATKMGSNIVFTISDHGIEFDPTLVTEADITLSAKDRTIGGLGIFLVKKIMDNVKYERIEGMNILTIEKNITL